MTEELIENKYIEMGISKEVYEFGKEISVVSPRFCIETDGEPEWNVAFSVRSEKCRSE